MPYQPWAAEEVKHLTEHMELDPTGHCHYEGIPHALYFGFQIIQTPKFIAFLHDNMHARRLVYMDGKPHPQGYSAWMGDSRGHWEGNTLVVDVADNNDKSVFDMAGHFHSDALHVVERFTHGRQRHHRLRSHLRRSQGIHASVQDEISNEEIGPSSRSPSNRTVSAVNAIRSISSMASPI